MKQYPHLLYVKTLSESIQDEFGNWSTSEESWILHSVCRDQPNGKSQQVNGQDGKSIIFSSVIHLPQKAERIIEGSEVKVTEKSGVERINKQCIKFDKGQLHCRIWV